MVSGFLIRWIGALVLVLGTINPSGYSYFHWITDGSDEYLPVKFVVGILIVIGLVMYLRTAWESLGALGLTLTTVLFMGILWWLIDAGWLNPDEPSVIAWVVLVVIATIMAIGMSWSFVRHKVTGQVDTV